MDIHEQTDKQRKLQRLGLDVSSFRHSLNNQAIRFSHLNDFLLCRMKPQ